MPKHGKKYNAVAATVDRDTYYAPRDAMALVKQNAQAKFDETVEVHLRTALDPRQADQQIRGVVNLPAGTGKKVRILVFAEGEGERLAREAGADFVGSDDLIQKIQGENWTDFDVAIAVPQVMSKVGRLGRILGTRGLMPNPKAGTIVQPEDLPRVIRETRQGRVEYRLDRTGNVHVPIGKASFEVDQLMENFAALMEAIVRAKPAALRGQYLRRVTVSSTMGPGVRIDAAQATSGRA
ncbi:MAG TPA: 50S ribosomal protein L1 [Anaerolineae bacterium]|nr:50S ribosomal protein L1 [Anaerolineae bacterium]HOQ99811.1 50S ribosomal protein L1 [Anaerolineae bacterium]HPL30107.1 50S ribosomal protein L1 [Anaerolineae bacterium]